MKKTKTIEMSKSKKKRTRFPSFFLLIPFLSVFSILANILHLARTNRKACDVAALRDDRYDVVPNFDGSTKQNIPKTVSLSTHVPLRIAHVWSPYVVRDANGNPFAPLDQAQNVTWESMYRAQQDFKAHNDDQDTLEIFCAVLWMDVEIIQRHNPPLCRPENIVILNRSTSTEYPGLSPQIHYPFLQDILEVPSDFDYLIYTNSDIAVVKNFYSFVLYTIRFRRFQAFTVNRKTLPREFKNETLHSGHIPLIENVLIPNGKPHPGYDCFVISRDVVKNINLGNLFLGHPPWGLVLKTILEYHMTQTFHSFESEVGWTYHLVRKNVGTIFCFLLFCI